MVRVFDLIFHRKNEHMPQVVSPEVSLFEEARQTARELKTGTVELTETVGMMKDPKGEISAGYHELGIKAGMSNKYQIIRTRTAKITKP